MTPESPILAELRPLLDALAEETITPEQHRRLKELVIAHPEAQAEYAKNIAYGPTNQKALAKLDAKVLANLPTSPANAKDAMQFGIKFWADQGEELEKRFASWAAQ